MLVARFHGILERRIISVVGFVVRDKFFATSLDRLLSEI